MARSLRPKEQYAELRVVAGTPAIAFINGWHSHNWTLDAFNVLLEAQHIKCATCFAVCSGSITRVGRHDPEVCRAHATIRRNSHNRPFIQGSCLQRRSCSIAEIKSAATACACIALCHGHQVMTCLFSSPAWTHVYSASGCLHKESKLTC